MSNSVSHCDSLLVCDDLVQNFEVRKFGLRKRSQVSALSHVSIEIMRGETFAVVGETGSGKSTLARAILRSPAATSGTISMSIRIGEYPQVLDSRHSPNLIQMIFQDPFAALDPNWTVARILAEPLEAAGITNRGSVRTKVAEMLARIGLPAETFADRKPRELSGGQAQRIAIGRALIASPQLVICDEPVTSLDVSVQAQILSLLYELKKDFGLTYMLVAHDLAVVRALADRTATMYLGRICEMGSTTALFDQPSHPYTAALLSAIPPRPGESLKRDRIRLIGEPPSPVNPPTGCRFHTRCTFSQERCVVETPLLRETSLGSKVACHFPLS